MMQQLDNYLNIVQHVHEHVGATVVCGLDVVCGLAVVEAVVEDCMVVATVVAATVVGATVVCGLDVACGLAVVEAVVEDSVIDPNKSVIDRQYIVGSIVYYCCSTLFEPT